MGQMGHFMCENCGFEAELGFSQPYYVMSGSITEKYCPRTGEIINVFRQYDAGPPEIGCQAEDYREQLHDPELCKNCKGECLQDLEIIDSVDDGDDKDVESYKCPRCGGTLRNDFTVMIFVD
jgi:hypothetical protein